MENQTWIKLFRKIVDHDIFNDESAFRVFMWILCSCDYKSGSMKSGRFWASERLGINPITYYKILKRLEKKYDLVTLESNNKNTTILVKKWSLYQEQSNNESNNKVTTKEQQSNTTQELRSKKILSKDNIYTEFIQWWNETYKTRYSINPGNNKTNFEVWIKQYNLLDMKCSVALSKFDDWWKDKLTPTMLFRQRDQNQQPCDNIGRFISAKYKDQEAIQIIKEYEEAKQNGNN